MPKTKPWKELPGPQVSEDALWEMTRSYSSYLTCNHNLCLSTDPLNLTGLNTKRDSGIANPRAIGIDFEAKERTVKEKKAKKKAQVVRFALRIKTKRQIPKARLVAVNIKKLQNNCVYSENKNITIRAIVKSIKRDLSNYRRDLVPLALRKLAILQKFKAKNKWNNKKEAKTIKAK